MPTERWARIREVFDRVIDLEPESRKSMLDACCGGDDELRREVESLVAESDEAENGIPRVVEDAARVMVGAPRRKSIGARS